MKVIYTDYWSGSHRPYRGVLRDRYDRVVKAGELIEELAKEAGAGDGDEIEIIVRKTGRRPFGSRKVKLTEPHEYKREKS